MSDSDDLLTSRAEALFAEVLARSDVDPATALEDAREAYPELAGRLLALEERRLELLDLEQLLRPGFSFVAEPPADTPPTLPGFRFAALLGRGGMGDVWEAEDLELERRVAIKLLRSPSFDSERAAARFRREALAAARLRHASVVSVLSVGEHDGTSYIVQELVPSGRSLYDALEDARRVGKVPPSWEAWIARTFVAVADALVAAHAAGIVHRDVKPHNILLAPDGTPKLADFGLAQLEGSDLLSRTGEFLGTWLYASPEQVASASGGVGTASDVFSLGVSLYECLTLQRPFRGDSLPEITDAIRNAMPPAPAEVRPRVPRDLSVITMKAIEKSIGGRYASMAELRDDLRRFLDGEPIRARPASLIARTLRWARRRPRLATAGAALIVALPVLGTALWRESRALAQSRASSAVEGQVVTLLDELFHASDPWNLGRRDPSVRDLVERGVSRLEAGEPSLPAARARVLATLGGVLASLGDSEGAARLLIEGDELFAELGLEDSDAARALRADLAGALVELGRTSEAQAVAESLTKLWNAGRLRPEDAYPAHIALGLAQLGAGRLDEARVALESAVEIATELAQPEGFEAPQARTLLAEVAWNAGRFEEGLAWLEKDTDWLRPLLVSGNGVALQSFNLRGMLLQSLGRLDEAEGDFVGVFEAAGEKLGPGHPFALNAGINLGTLWLERGLASDAEELFVELADVAAEHLGPTSTEALLARNNLAYMLQLRGATDEALVILGEILDAELREHGEADFATSVARFRLAAGRAGTGDFDGAIELLEDALPHVPGGHPMRAETLDALERYRVAAARRD